MYYINSATLLVQTCHHRVRGSGPDQRHLWILQQRCVHLECSERVNLKKQKLPSGHQDGRWWEKYCIANWQSASNVDTWLVNSRFLMVKLRINPTTYHLCKHINPTVQAALTDPFHGATLAAWYTSSCSAQTLQKWCVWIRLGSTGSR